MKKYKIIIISLVLLTFAIVGISLAYFDEIVPIHFGPNGKPDQNGSKYFMWVFPSIELLIALAMLLVSKYGKVSENYKKYMLLTGVIIELIFSTIAVIFAIYALNYVEDKAPFDMSKPIMIIFGLLFIVMGNFMPKIEKNRTLGLKTKWSMYNEVTWQKSHRFVGFVSVIVGILVFISGLFFKDMVNFIILMSLVAVLVTSSTIMSYIYYKDEKAKELGA